GAKTLRAFIDSACLTAESDENNNWTVTPYSVVPQDLDLAVSALVLSPGSSPSANATFDAVVTVTNRGTAATAAGASLQVWADQAAAPACGALGNQAATLPGLAGGASHTVTLTGLPAGAAGAKTLRAFVDSACLTAETDEGNNQRATPYEVVAPAPNFAVSAVVLSSRTPPVNGTVAATITVTNWGPVPGAAGTLRVWADQPGVPACGAAADQSVALPSLVAGASTTLTVSGLAAGGLGVKTLRAFVDGDCLTAETDEGDNQTTVGYAVGTNEQQRIASRFDTSFAIQSDGSLWGWGQGGNGEVGDGWNNPFHPGPIQVLTGVAAVASGNIHTLALRTDGSLWAWGGNTSGQLGNGTLTGALIPAPVPGLSGVTAMAGGLDYSLAVQSDGSLWAWGANAHGQLGDGTVTRRLSPVQVMTGVMAVAAGAYHSLALKTDGSLWAWGDNFHVQVGDGTGSNRTLPVQVMTGVVAVAAGENFSLALKGDGSLWAWGYNWLGALGDGTTIDRALPVQVMTGVAAMAAGGTHSLGLKTDGSVWAWGDDGFGQIGDGTQYGSRPHPTQVLTGAVAVAGGFRHSLARKADGSLWAWGQNNYGQLGDNTVVDRLVPVQVAGIGAATPRPDFAVTNIALTPANPSANGTLTATVTVTNQGLAAGASGVLQLWTDRAAPVDCGGVGDQSAVLPSLAAGASATVTLTGLPAGAAGAKTLRAFVNSACQTLESDDSNNQTALAYNVGTLIPDFVIGNVVLTQPNPSANGTFSGAVTVTNRGSAAGVPGALQVWSNQTGAPACGALGERSATLSSLAAGASQTVTLTGLAAGAAGAKTLGAFIDSACLTAESDETNNWSGTPYTVVPQDLDLAVTALVLSPGSRPSANTTFDAIVTVTNQGTAATAAGASLQVWADQSTAAACGALGSQAATLPSLAGGASHTVTLTGLPAGAAGAKTLRAFVDSACLTAETDEGNNQRATPYEVVAPAPNFAVSDLVINAPAPTVNGTFAATVTVTNWGQVPGAAGTLRVWADQATVPACGAAADQSIALPSLAAGAGTTVTVSGLAAGGLGVKTLRAFVDGDCVTAEGDEGDNQRTRGYAVGTTEQQRIATKSDTSFAIQPDGSLWGWGAGGNGQIGDGWSNGTHPAPIQVLTGVAAVAAGNVHTLALRTDGSLWDWGDNAVGRLGNGTTISSLVPLQVMSGVTAMAGGFDHSLAVQSDGSLWAWGDNARGQLGDGTLVRRLSPVQVLTGVAAAAAGAYHSLALKTDGS
ncbi:CARDB domain-containing protein, partial [uncultured Thiodictyon sp.]|uniref:RCC1 domain-containing protein n=1 Tax=uncultured Thiodictyon sp. TaxID=1846217 RepID=UPI0025E615A1